MIAHEPTTDGRLFCRVCGEGTLMEVGARGQVDHARCAKHLDRNPCAIDGCARTQGAGGRYSDSGFLCGEHWRRYCPPRSARRRAYHRFFRTAKKRGGWDDELALRFWRFWDTLVASARARHVAGAVDVAEINRIMGW